MSKIRRDTQQDQARHQSDVKRVNKQHVAHQHALKKLEKGLILSEANNSIDLQQAQARAKFNQLTNAPEGTDPTGESLLEQLSPQEAVEYQKLTVGAAISVIDSTLKQIKSTSNAENKTRGLQKIKEKLEAQRDLLGTGLESPDELSANASDKNGTLINLYGPKPRTNDYLHRWKELRKAEQRGSQGLNFIAAAKTQANPAAHAKAVAAYLTGALKKLDPQLTIGLYGKLRQHMRTLLEANTGWSTITGTIAAPGVEGVFNSTLTPMGMFEPLKPLEEAPRWLSY